MTQFLFDVINEKPINDYELTESKKRNIFDFVNAINIKIDLKDELQGYNQYIINKAFSYFRDTILISNEINKYSINDHMHFFYYFTFVTKKKRFTKWSKPKYNEDDVNLIIEYYNINHRKALEIMDLVDIDLIKKSFYHGGMKK